MTLATGIGSMPGGDAQAFDEAVRLVLGELPDLPHLPELPGRGATADMTGRALAVTEAIHADLQPAGWRLTGASGMDQRRARSLLAQDLDAVEELAQGFTGRFKIQTCGPWTLAATVERPRGDRVLADHGARRDLAQALAEGLRLHLADVRRRLPGAEILCQLDEPLLPAVLAGRVPTASGFHRHRSVHVPEASTALGWVFDAVRESGAVPLAHCCASDVPLSLLSTAGAAGVSLDVTALGTARYDELAAVMEHDALLFLGVVPAADPAVQPDEGELTKVLLRMLERLGLDPAVVGERLAVTPTCGLAGASPAWARRALELSGAVARNLDG